MKQSNGETHSSIPDVTGAILAGGQSRRMGQDKALLPLGGRPMVQRVADCLCGIFDRVILVGDRPERFASLGLPVIPDLHPGSALGGIHAALRHGAGRGVFVVPCDLPFPSAPLIRHLLALAPGRDVVVPRSPRGLEPLFAYYGPDCLDAVEELLAQNNFRIFDFYPRVRTLEVDLAALPGLDPDGRAFVNINTPADLEAAEGVLER
jgi:molybdopterin-guanine dinucleotide biosynthesis protein B/molybdopterin-guanine dinucleotide biosynthesis protein